MRTHTLTQTPTAGHPATADEIFFSPISEKILRLSVDLAPVAVSRRPLPPVGTRRHERRRWARTPSIRRPSPGTVPLVPLVPLDVGACAQQNPADGYRMGRWARLAITATVLVAVVVVTVSLLAVPASRVLVDVTVGPGDTLWSIATSAAPNRDPREVIGEIEQLNGLERDVLPIGVVLRVPSSPS